MKKNFIKAYEAAPDVTPANKRRHTGCIDRNANPIREGDIIRFFGGKVFTGGVWEYQGQFIITSPLSEDHITCFVLENIANQVIPSQQPEVIGNIYENPELLNDIDFSTYDGMIWSEEDNGVSRLIELR